MASILQGSLYVPYFEPTANLGEYNISGATFSNASDLSGNGAYGITTAELVVYTQAVDNASGLPILGVVHRYLLSNITIVDSTTIEGLLNWNELGDEQDAPLNGSFCLVSEQTPIFKYGLPPPDSIYPDVPAGMTSAALSLDIRNITDNLPVGGGGSGATFKLVQYAASTTWIVSHGKNSVDFTYSVFNDAGESIFPESVAVQNANTILVSFSIPVSGKAIFSFI